MADGTITTDRRHALRRPRAEKGYAKLMALLAHTFGVESWARSVQNLAGNLSSFSVNSQLQLHNATRPDFVAHKKSRPRAGFGMAT